MNRRQKIIVSITGIFIVLLALVGLTYAYFLTRITGNENDKSISVQTANLVVEYGDGNGMLKAINNIEPGDTIEFAEVDENGNFILDQNGNPIKHTTKTFTVENKGNDTATYSLVLTDITNTLERNQDLEFTLTKNGVELTEGLDLNHIAAGTHQILLPKVSIAKDGVDTYTLSIEYVEAGIDQSEDMNSIIEFKIDIENEKTTWNNSKEGTLTYALKNASDVGTTIGNTEDDYGTSYYYKGDVTNNFVNYSGMCWRVVRVQGDGTIKLVLADDEYECDSNGYDTTNEISSFIKVNDESQSNEYASHWVYTGSKVTSYEGSDLKTYINNWASKLTNKSNLVKSSWCNDMSYGYMYYVYDENFNATYHYEWKPEFTTKEYLQVPLYGSAQRQRNNDPSLKCNFKGLENSHSLRVETSHATLTLDEIKLALNGATNSYLDTNANGTLSNCGDYGSCSGYLTLSPSNDSDGVYDSFAHIFTNKNIVEITPHSSFTRPAITIKSDVILDKNISGQNGTYQHPYEID